MSVTIPAFFFWNGCKYTVPALAFTLREDYEMQESDNKVTEYRGRFWNTPSYCRAPSSNLCPERFFPKFKVFMVFPSPFKHMLRYTICLLPNILSFSR